MKKRKSIFSRMFTVVVMASVTLLLAIMACPATAGNDGVIRNKKNPDPKIQQKIENIVKNKDRNRDRTDLGTTWYLAEGTTAWGFNTIIGIVNPLDTDTYADLTFMTPSGPVYFPDVYLRGLSQTKINPADIIGQDDFSTKVECEADGLIAVDRIMSWSGKYSPGLHSSIGVSEPAPDWYLAEGSTGGDFETWVLVQNPGTSTATVNLTYNTPNGPIAGPTMNIPPGSRQTANVEEFVKDTYSVSTKVSANRPVIAERAMYWKERSGGHESIGTTDPAEVWFLPEGCTGGDFETWVLVQNPNNQAAQVEFGFVTDSGYVNGPIITLGPNSRETIEVEKYAPDRWEVSTWVSSNRPVIAERAMYGNGRAWGHDSIGMIGPHDILMFPSGESRTEGNITKETWTLIVNLNDQPVDVYIACYTPAESDIYYTGMVTMPAYSRYSFNMIEAELEGLSAATLVYCDTPGCKVSAEQSMYVLFGDTRVAGACTIGAVGDVE